MEGDLLLAAQKAAGLARPPLIGLERLHLGAEGPFGARLWWFPMGQGEVFVGGEPQLALFSVAMRLAFLLGV